MKTFNLFNGGTNTTIAEIPNDLAHSYFIKLNWTYKDGNSDEVDLSSLPPARKKSGVEFGTRLIQKLQVKCLVRLQNVPENSWFRYQETKPDGEGWGKIDNCDKCWLNEIRGHPRKIKAIQKILYACDITSATLEYEPKSESVEVEENKNKMKKASNGTDKEKTKESTYQRNRIIFGAPGTGKSHETNLDANELFFGERKKENSLSEGEKEMKAARMERVTFHPEYSYFDFVGSYKPLMRNVPVMYVDGGILKTAEAEEGGLNTERKIEYDFVPGPFARILVKALKDQEHPHLLLIEEINRSRVAAVFGDIFQLLDRTKEGESEYPICLSEDLKEHLGKQGLQLNELKLPPNLYIWATMNSADQGVYPLDTAFKRRWSIEYQPLDVDVTSNEVESYNETWDTIRKGINGVLLDKKINEDKLMGYFFLKKEEMDTAMHLKEALAGKVLMYLFEDAAKAIRKDIFQKEIPNTYSELQRAMQKAMKDEIKSDAKLGIFQKTLWDVKSVENDKEENQGDNQQ